jgi:hypothetical protein
MKQLVLFAVTLGALSITSQASDAANQRDQYLCVADKRIGFVYNNRLDAYDVATFQAGKNFTISLSSAQSSAFAFVITEARKSRPSGYCENGFNDYGIIFCKFGGDFRFNKYKGTFITISAGGYDDDPSGASMEIGKCSSF